VYYGVVSHRDSSSARVTFMNYLAEEVYPEAECITVILDNLNTHDPAAFYERPSRGSNLLQKQKRC